MKYLLAIIFIIPIQYTDAQITTGRQYGRHLDESSAMMTDMLGQPIHPQQQYNWEGKVFFPDEYTYATITSMSGKVYRNIKAKINLLDNTLLFTDSAKKEYAVTIPVAKVEFEDALTATKNVFIKPAGDTGRAMFLLLDSGKISLLKKITITYKDQVPYGSTIITRFFEQKYSYLVYANGNLSAIDRSRSALMDIMADKKDKVEAFIEAEKLKMRKEEDFIKVFRFYNRLE